MQKLTQDRIKLAEYARSIHSVNVPDSVKVEDILAPEFWAHVTAKLRQFDRVEVLCEDGSWLAELIVLEVGKVYAKMFLLHTVDLAKETEEIPTPSAGFYIKWASPITKFRVHRVTDNQVVKDGFESKSSAEDWANEFFKSKAA